jgi:nitroimidazol reductase NimA-like FMN-containing flavoprotein (pyridoxamine 5'-phosphate oxidase superfamily)
MVNDSVTRLDALEIASFLDGKQTGVLSMAAGDKGYGIPVSFAFDEDEHDMYFRLGYAEESQKRRFVDAAEQVTFVVYEETADGWTSVLALGELEEVSTENLDSTVVQVVRDLDIPYFAVHAEPSSDMTFSIVRLDVTELSGIVEG